MWLDEQPVAQFTDSYDAAGTYQGTTVTYLYADHLGTSRIGTDASKAITWRHQSDAFGVGTPSGTASVRLRMPGQIDLGILGIGYNYFRDYDPQVGRYVESDPIGLEGGLNPYLYVGARPTDTTDPTGEFGVVGATIGGGFDLALQLIENGGNLRCVDINSVLISAAFGAIAPGAFNTVRAARQGQNARRAIEVLSARQAAAQTASRAARVGQSIQRNARAAYDANTTVIQQASAQVGEFITKAIASPTPLRVGNDCECQRN